MAFIQGFLASLKFDGNDITFVTADVTLSESRTVLDKSVMDGIGRSQSIPGKRSGTLSITGHVDQVNLNLLEAAWAKDTTVAFELEIAEGKTTDAKWVGMLTLTSFDKSTAADSNWAFTLSGETVDLAYTAMVP